MNPESNMPSAIDAEKTILGAILLTPSAMEEATYLKADDFFLDSHRRIFRAMASLAEEKTPIDLVTLSDQLERTKDLQAVAGTSYLATLPEGVPRRPSIGNYVRIVREKAALRSIILASHNTILKASEPGADGAKLASDYRAKLAEISEELNEGTLDGIRMIGEYAPQYWESMNRMREGSGDVIGLTYSIRCLDETTTGMRRGENTVIGGRPGAGKSSFALTAAIKNAQAGKTVYYRSDEMGGDTVFSRTLSNLSSVNNFLLRNPRKLTFPDLQFLAAARDESKILPLIIDEKPGLHIDTILNRAYQCIKNKNAELCIFDYLQIIKGDGKDRNERVGNISEAIAGFAREMKVHCMMLSQLTRPDKKHAEPPAPNLTDLRESGRIEDNADVVILLHRSSKGDFAIIPKQRNGPVGEMEILFEAATLTYRDK